MRLSRRLMRKRPVRGFRVGGGGHEVDGVRPAAVFSFWFFKTFGKGGLKMDEFWGWAIGAACFLAWLTHIFTCFAHAMWGFLLAGAIFFPIGILHGFYLWFK